MFSVSSSDNPERVYRAGWVVVSASEIIQNGYVRTKNGKIIGVGAFPGTLAGSPMIIDMGPGIIFPGTLNCHTHLELSFLKDKIDVSQGFRKWVQDLISLRSKTPEEIIIESGKKALLGALRSGTAYVADISTLGLSKQFFLGSSVAGIGFHEFLGALNDLVFSLPDSCSSNHSFSFSAHAPHTTSPELISFLKKETLKKNLPFSIHLDESDDEREFITKGKGDWADFLSSRNIDFKSWPLPSKSPVIYAEKMGILDPTSLCVHLCGCSEKDLEIIKKYDAKICLCPRSNMNLHGILPPVEKMISMGIKPCLGTDSLASASSLSIFDEIRFLSKEFSGIDSISLFEMATINGAAALGVSDYYGTLEPGKASFMIYSGDVPLSESDVFDLFVFGVNAEVL